MNKFDENNIDSKVISSYLNGKSRDVIAKECGISTGKTSAIIKKWKERIMPPNINELRRIAVLMNKSGITIEQSILGYRIFSILKSFGIEAEHRENYKNTNDKHNFDFYSFIKQTYLNCIKFKIVPSVLFSLAIDLFECYSYLDDDCQLPLINREFAKGYWNIHNSKNSSSTDDIPLKIYQTTEKKKVNITDIDKDNNNLIEMMIILISKKNNILFVR